MKSPIVRRCFTGIPMLVQHEIDVPACCPISRNPFCGSRMAVTYRPSRGVVLPVETLRDMVAEYAGGHAARGVRGMEEMIQDIAARTAHIVGTMVRVRADLIIVPFGGGDPQMMRVACRADPDRAEGAA
jgi:hypothetical protein